MKTVALPTNGQHWRERRGAQTSTHFVKDVLWHRTFWILLLLLSFATGIALVAPSLLLGDFRSRANWFPILIIATILEIQRPLFDQHSACVYHLWMSVCVVCVCVSMLRQSQWMCQCLSVCVLWVSVALMGVDWICSFSWCQIKLTRRIFTSH